MLIFFLVTQVCIVNPLFVAAMSNDAEAMMISFSRSIVESIAHVLTASISVMYVCFLIVLRVCIPNQYYKK